MDKLMKNTIGYFKIKEENLSDIDYYIDNLRKEICDIIYYDINGSDKFSKLINECKDEDILVYFDGNKIYKYNISGILKIFQDTLGDQICGRPKGVTEDRKSKMIEAKIMKDNGVRVVDIADHFGVKVVTVYNWLKDIK